MSSARRLRLVSASSSARSAAAVERRSSQNAIGNSVSGARLRTKARVDCARGPSVPSRLIGQAGNKAANAMLFREAEKLLHVGLELGPADGFKRRRDLAHHVGKRKPDGFGANVEAKQALIAPQPLKKLWKFEKLRWHNFVLVCC